MCGIAISARDVAQAGVAEAAVLALVREDARARASRGRARRARQDRERLEVAAREVAAELPEAPPAVERDVGEDEVARVRGPAAARQPVGREPDPLGQLARWASRRPKLGPRVGRRARSKSAPAGRRCGPGHAEGEGSPRRHLVLLLVPRRVKRALAGFSLPLPGQAAHGKRAFAGSGDGRARPRKKPRGLWAPRLRGSSVAMARSAVQRLVNLADHVNAGVQRVLSPSSFHFDGQARSASSPGRGSPELAHQLFDVAL